MSQVDQYLEKRVWCTFQIEGFHSWPEAAGRVFFLSHRHRHMFRFRAEVGVGGNNRELEFITLRDNCVEYLEGVYPSSEEKFGLDFGSSSCEMIAQTLVERLIEATGSLQKVSVEVSEDGENGAVVSYAPPKE